jgi:hypothetical protein
MLYWSMRGCLQKQRLVISTKFALRTDFLAGLQMQRGLIAALCLGTFLAATLPGAPPNWSRHLPCAWVCLHL